MLLSGIHDFIRLQTGFPPKSVAGMTESGVLQLPLFNKLIFYHAFLQKKLKFPLPVVDKSIKRSKKRKEATGSKAAREMA